MIVVRRATHIDAPVERVFALMADPGARARLNPNVTPIEVEIEGGTALALGSVCHFRVQSGGRVLDYRTRVREFSPNQRIVSLSDSAVPFEVSIETVREDGGTRLTQTERFEPTDEMLHEALPAEAADMVRRWLQPLLLFFDSDAAERLRRREEEALTERLAANMDRWLAAIKRHLEAERTGPG